jgi:hypothetical protein
LKLRICFSAISLPSLCGGHHLVFAFAAVTVPCSIWMTRLWPDLIDAVQVVQPETILRWHRAGFKVFWRWKSRNRAGRPKIDRGLRDLIRRMSRENALWGASRIHGELLMLGFQVAQSTVSKYMVRPSKAPSQDPTISASGRNEMASQSRRQAIRRRRVRPSLAKMPFDYNKFA